MMDYVIGIDPGITGSICILDLDGNYIDHLLMPSMKIGKANRVNSAAIVAWLEQYKDAKHCYLEKVHAMPGNGSASMFSFGHSAGIAEGVIVAFGVPLTLVTPQSWKKTSGLIGKDKDVARTRAIQLYPNIRDLDFKGRGQALADSILIARANL
jgi:crossover junction endodeoxyribonuclease RuvC